MTRSVFGGGSVAKSDSGSVSASSIVAQTVKGSHVLKINGYSRIKALGSGTFISTGEFDIGGVTWDIRYYPNGCTPKTSGWIGIILHLRHNHATGVEASYAFSLLDGAGEPVKSYDFPGKGAAHTFKCADTGHGSRRFIMRKALEGSAYLKDDSFSIRCDITVSTTAVRVPRSVVVPPPDMHRHIGRLLESQVGTDVTFQVGEETFAAHQLVVAAQSPVFMAQLFGSMKERSTSHVVRIDDMEPGVFKAMLHFIYTESLPDMDRGDDAAAMAQHLLVAADRYGLERLKLICEDSLCDYINTGTAATTLVLAEQHGSGGLKEACIEFLKSPGNLKETMDSYEFQHLTSCPSLLSELLANVAP